MSSNIEELIIDEEIQPQQRKERKSAKPKSLRKKKTEEAILTEEVLHDLTRKKDILVFVATLEDFEYYTGEKLSPAKIRFLPKDRIDALFEIYQAKLGQEMTEDSMKAIVGTAVKLAAFAVTFDDEEALKKDLMDNKKLRRMLGVKAAGVAENYGDFVAWGESSLTLSNMSRCQTFQRKSRRNSNF